MAFAIIFFYRESIHSVTYAHYALRLPFTPTRKLKSCRLSPYFLSWVHVRGFTHVGFMTRQSIPLRLRNLQGNLRKWKKNYIHSRSNKRALSCLGLLGTHTPCMVIVQVPTSGRISFSFRLFWITNTNTDFIHDLSDIHTLTTAKFKVHNLI